MELKTIKEFCHKNNLGEGLVYSNGVFKTNLDNKFNTIDNKITEINNTLNKVYKVKGSTTVSGINSMTVGNAMVGCVYNLTDSGTIINGIGGELNVVKGDNVVYTENGWDQFAASLDLDQCAGDNISIEDNVISALGYTYDAEKNSFAVGIDTTASGWGSYAEGFGSIASGNNSHAEGSVTTASSAYSHAEGSNTVASGISSHAEGNETTASGNFSHAEGQNTVASANNAHAEGQDTIASGGNSHTEGRGTTATNDREHAQGSYNISNKKSINFGDAGNTLHSIGIGTSDEARKNAQEVMQNGDHYIIGIGEYDGTIITGAQTLQEVISNKVDKEDNKGLSTEDYTTEEKTKLNGIEEGAQVNIQSDWNQLDETLKDYIKNKPDLTIYQLKEEGKSLTSNDYTTEDKEKLSGIEAGAQVNEVTSVNNMKGDVTIVTNQAFPESFNISGTTLEFAQSINLEDTAINGMTYLGGVSLSDLPESLVNAECLVQVIASAGDGSKVIHFDLYSADTQPYHWSCMYYNRSVTDWVSYVTSEDQASIIESLEQEINLLKEKVNSKEYSIDFESDSTTAQEINLMDSMSLKKLVGYNITGVNLQIGTGSAINLTLTDNIWEGDPITINQGERVYWDIIKYDESAPAVLGIYETKIL